MRRTAHKSPEWTSPYAGWYDLFSSGALPMPNAEAFNNIHADPTRTNQSVAQASTTADAAAAPAARITTEQLRTRLAEHTDAERQRFVEDQAGSDTLLNALFEANAPIRDAEDQTRNVLLDLQAMSKKPESRVQFPVLTPGLSHMPYRKLSQREQRKQFELNAMARKPKLPSSSPTYKHAHMAAEVDQILQQRRSIPADLEASAAQVTAMVRERLGAADPADLVRDIPLNNAQALSAEQFNDMLRRSPLVTSTNVDGGIAFGRIIRMTTDVADVDIGGKLFVRIPVPPEAVLSAGLLVPVLVLSSELTFSFIGQRKTSSTLRGTGVHVGALLRHELFTQARIVALNEIAHRQ